ncbi:MAG: hypothetical protein JXC36_09645 [Candidatus Atribacteria bacterium]|nr:hypothetical protein [Candidatus Atribacteria bacterium]
MNSISYSEIINFFRGKVSSLVTKLFISFIFAIFVCLTIKCAKTPGERYNIVREGLEQNYFSDYFSLSRRISTIVVSPPILELEKPEFIFTRVYRNSVYKHTSIGVKIDYTIVFGTKPGYYNCKISFYSFGDFIFKPTFFVEESILILNKSDASLFNMGIYLIFISLGIIGFILYRVDYGPNGTWSFKVAFKDTGKPTLFIFLFGLFILLIGIILLIFGRF